MVTLVVLVDKVAVIMATVVAEVETAVADLLVDFALVVVAEQVVTAATAAMAELVLVVLRHPDWQPTPVVAEQAVGQAVIKILSLM